MCFSCLRYFLFNNIAVQEHKQTSRQFEPPQAFTTDEWQNSSKFKLGDVDFICLHQYGGIRVL